MKLENIFENDLIIVSDTKKDYDLRYVIENKKDHKINFYLNGLDDYLEIDKNSWLGLFNGEYSKIIIDSLINEDYTWNYIYE